MIFKRERFEHAKARLMAWHKWYAWHPVFWDGGGAWLEWLERRADEMSWDGYGGYVWEYRQTKPLTNPTNTV